MKHETERRKLQREAISVKTKGGQDKYQWKRIQKKRAKKQ